MIYNPYLYDANGNETRNLSQNMASEGNFDPYRNVKNTPPI